MMYVDMTYNSNSNINYSVTNYNIGITYKTVQEMKEMKEMKDMYKENAIAEVSNLFKRFYDAIYPYKMIHSLCEFESNFNYYKFISEDIPTSVYEEIYKDIKNIFLKIDYKIEFGTTTLINYCIRYNYETTALKLDLLYRKQYDSYMMRFIC